MKKHSWTIVLFMVLSLIYTWQLFGIPPDQASLAKYQLSYAAAQILRLSIAVPVIASWFMALYGSLKIERYAQLMRKTSEALVWRRIAQGFLWLALSLPLSAVTANWLSSLAVQAPELKPVTVILQNYTSLVLTLIAIGLIHLGLQRLFKSTVVQRRLWHATPLYMLAFFVISAIFIALTLSNPNRQFANSNGQVAYYLSDFWLVLTIVIPYVYIWYAGIRSIEYLHAYRTFVKGAIYKNSVKYLISGMSLVLASLLSLRLLISMSTMLNSATLKIILLLIYCLVFIIGIGHFLLAVGAQKLAKIEEI